MAHVEGTRVRISVDGVEVEGEIRHRCGGDVCVRIVSPFRNLSTGSHIPCFARGYRSYAGAYGDETAAALLRELYLLARHLDAELPRLREALARAKEAIRGEAAGIDEAEFDARKRELRQRMRRGEIDPVSHQRELGALRKSLYAYNRKAWAVMEAFFRRDFPMTVPCGLQSEVQAVLEGRAEFK